MNFNVYIDEQTGARLGRAAKARGTSRNALIREALSRFLHQAETAHWPESILSFNGDQSAPRFEEARKKLRAPSKDPLA